MSGNGIQTTFRFTDAEYSEHKRINRLNSLPRWKAYLIVSVCLLPSALLVVLTGYWLVAMFVFSMMLVLVVKALLVFVRAPKSVDLHDHHLTMTALSKYERLSHSEFEVKWTEIDEMQETETVFLLRRLSRYAMLPKRVIPQDRLAEFRSYCAMVGRSPSGDQPPVPLYQRTMVESSTRGVWRLTYRASDLANAVLHRLVVVPERRVELKPSRARGWLLVVWLGLAFLAVFYLVSIQPAGLIFGQLDGVLIGLLVIAAVLPFFLIRLVNRFIRAHAIRNLPETPQGEVEIALLVTGMGIGNPAGMAFYDWRDIEAFYQNQFCFGFKAVLGFVQIIPKRMFKDPVAAENFLIRALVLRREHRNRFKTAVKGVETGNPYQSPASPSGID